MNSRLLAHRPLLSLLVVFFVSVLTLVGLALYGPHASRAQEQLGTCSCDYDYSSFQGGELCDQHSTADLTNETEGECYSHSPCSDAGFESDIEGDGWGYSGCGWTPDASAPAVVTNAASLLSSSGATLNGSANPNGAAATGWYRYSTTNPGNCSDTFGTKVPAGGSALGSGTSFMTIPGSSVTGLTSGTTYYYCAIASNPSGIGFGTVASFTTTSGGGGSGGGSVSSPSVTTRVASGITTSSATLRGTANPNGTAATGWYRYSTTNPGSCNDTFGTKVPEGGSALGSGIYAVSIPNASLAGLAKGTTYYFCAVASNVGGYGFGNVRSFTTSSGNPPTVTTNDATSLTASTATLNGIVNPNGAVATGWFRYSVTNPGSCSDNFGTRTPSSGGTSLGSGSGNISYASSISSLTPNTTYYACAIASNANGTRTGALVSFTTSAPSGPTVATNVATGVSSSGMTFNGAVSATGGNNPSQCGFAAGTSASLSGGDTGTTTATCPASTGAFSIATTTLSADTTYYFRAYATNSTGTGYGTIQPQATAANGGSAGVLPDLTAGDVTPSALEAGMPTTLSAPIINLDNALSFNSTAFVQFVSGTGYNNVTFTASAWIKTFTAVSAVSPVIEYSDSLKTRHGISLGSTGVPKIMYNDGVGDCRVNNSTSGDIDDGAWHLVTEVVNAGAPTLYVDGSPVGLGSAASCQFATTANLLEIGTETNSPGTNRFKGVIDDVRLYSQALSAADVQSIYAGNPPSSGLIGYWPFDTVTGATTPDLSGSNNTGTLANSPPLVAGIAGASTGATDFVNLFQIDNDSDHNSVLATAVSGSMNNLAPGATQTASGSYTFPAAGAYYLRACSDKDASGAGTVSETNEGNNCGDWTQVSVSSSGGASAVAGMCSATHYNCSPGTSIDQADTGAAWTWECEDQGLSGDWTFDTADFSGSTIADRSGSGITGTLTNFTGVPTVAGPVNQALAFDGTNDFVSINGLATALAAGSLTVSLWFNPSATITGANEQIMFFLGDWNSGNDIRLCTIDSITGHDNCNAKPGSNPGSLCFEIYNGGWNDACTTQTTWTAGTWYHAVGIFDTSSGEALYVNGTLVATNPTASRGAGLSQSAAIGANSNQSGGVSQGAPVDPFYGAIDDVRVYNQALSAADVERLYSKTNVPDSCSESQAPTASITADSTSINAGQSTLLRWSCTGSTSATLNGANLTPVSSGSQSTGVLNSPGDYPYQVICSNSNGQSANASVTVTVNSPDAAISASPTRVVSGGSTTLTWSASNVKQCGVTDNHGVTIEPTSSADEGGEWSTGSGVVVNNITMQTIYTISCTTGGGAVSSVTSSAVVNTGQSEDEF